MQVRSCDVCQKNNHKLQKASGTLHPIPVPSKIWCQVGMDLIGPMPATSRGNKYIITFTDYFSKWAEAAPLPDKTAQGVANFIYSVSHKSCFHITIHVFCQRVYLDFYIVSITSLLTHTPLMSRMGCPETLITDQDQKEKLRSFPQAEKKGRQLNL